MKEIISPIIFLAGVLGGGIALKNFGEIVRRAALEKVAQGLPSPPMVKMNNSL